MQLTSRLNGGRLSRSRLSGRVFDDAPAITPPDIESIVVGAWTGSSRDITYNVTGMTTGVSLIHAVIIPDADDNPIAAEVVAGEANGGGSPTHAFSFLWGADPTTSLPGGIARGNYRIVVVADNGALSDVASSLAFTICTVSPVLSAPLAAADGSDIDCSVTSDTGFGEILFGLRLAADGVLSASDIIDTVGNCIATDVDDTPAADDTNAGGFIGASDGTYVVDMVQVDEFGNISAVVSSSNVVIASAPFSFSDDFNSYAAGNPLSTENAAWVAQTGVSSANCVATGLVRTTSGAQGNFRDVSAPDDVIVTAVVGTSTPVTEIRVYARQADASNAYFCRFRSAVGIYVVYKRVGGVDTQIGTGALAALSSGMSIALEVIGDQIQPYRDGVALGSPITDASIASGGGIGFMLMYPNDDITSIAAAAA